MIEVTLKHPKTLYKLGKINLQFENVVFFFLTYLELIGLRGGVNDSADASNTFFLSGLGPPGEVPTDVTGETPLGRFAAVAGVVCWRSFGVAFLVEQKKPFARQLSTVDTRRCGLSGDDQSKAMLICVLCGCFDSSSIKSGYSSSTRSKCSERIS